MRFLLVLTILGQASCQIYQAAKATRERKNLLGPFSVSNQSDCELACNCARGDARKVLDYADDCKKFDGVVKPMNCSVYYYTASWCSFLGDYTVNTCMLPIVEYQLVAAPPSTSTTHQTTTKWDHTTTAQGVWSEWSTIGPCATTCGSCSNATRTRTCTGGPCEGAVSDDVGPCGIRMCSFPAETCCFSYKKTLNLKTNAWYCGPGGSV